MPRKHPLFLNNVSPDPSSTLRTTGPVRQDHPDLFSFPFSNSRPSPTSTPCSSVVSQRATFARSISATSIARIARALSTTARRSCFPSDDPTPMPFPVPGIARALPFAHADGFTGAGRRDSCADGGGRNGGYGGDCCGGAKENVEPGGGGGGQEDGPTAKSEFEAGWSASPARHGPVSAPSAG